MTGVWGDVRQERQDDGVAKRFGLNIAVLVWSTEDFGKRVLLVEASFWSKRLFEYIATLRLSVYQRESWRKKTLKRLTKSFTMFEWVLVFSLSFTSSHSPSSIPTNS